MRKSYTLLTAALVMLCGLFAEDSFATARTWVGAGAGGGSTDFNAAGNWSPSGVPGSADDLSITLTSSATVALTASVTVNSISFIVNIASGTSYGYLDAAGNTLTVNGAATIYGNTYGGGNWDIAEIDAGGSGGGFIFKGTTQFQVTGGGDVHFAADITNPGLLTFEGNVTFGPYCWTTPGDEPNFAWDGSGTQTATMNQVTSYTMGESLTFGSSNTPTVNFAGTNPWRFNCYEKDVTIAANTTVNMLSGALDNYLGGGTSSFIMGANSRLRIYGTSSFPGDNLTGFNDYASYGLATSSAVEYYGSSQTIKGGIAYGDLEIKGSGTKTSGSSFSVSGNWINNTTFNNGSDTHTFNGTSDQLISGSNAPNFYNLVVNKTGTLRSSVNFNAINELQMDAGTLLLDGETVEARTAVDMNGGTLQITGGTFTLDENSNTAWSQTGGTVDIDGGTVNIGDVSTDNLTDINIGGGSLDINGGTVNISDELDQSAGTVTISNTAVVNVAAFTGADPGTAAPKLNLSGGTFNMSGGTLAVKGAFDNTITYPAIDLNASTVNITGGTISATETGSNDESYYINTRGQAISNLTVDKTAGGGTSTVNIYVEDFEDLAAGTETDAGATAWSSACTGGGTCGLGDASSNDYFQVRSSTGINGSRLHEGRDMDNEAKWSSASVDISAHTNVGASIELAETGYDNASDYIRVYYQLDGGSETLLTDGSQSGGFNSATATVAGLTGSTLQIHIYVMCNGGNDRGRFDDVTISGDIATSSGQVMLAGPLDIDGDFTLTDGEFDVTASNHAVSVAGDWTNTGATFVEQNGTVTFDGGVAQALTNTSGETFYNLTMNKSANEMSLNDNIEVANTLTLTDGVMTTGSDRVFVSNSSAASVTGHSSASFVNGNLRRAIASNTSTYDFPVGNGTTASDYFQADVVNNSMTGVSYIDGSFGAAPAGGTLSLSEEGTDYGSIAPEGVWFLDPNSDPGTGDYGVNLHVDNFAGLADNQFMPLKRPSGSSDAADWNCSPCGFGNPGIPTNGSAGRTLASGYANRLGYTTFSQHGIGVSDAPLPIQLVEFAAEAQDNNTVLLTWATASEINNEWFAIERTVDGENFELVGRVQGAGTYSGTLFYELVDEAPVSGVSYYRLRQTDFDGTTTISDLRQVELDARNLVANVYPNPSNGLNVFLELEGVEHVRDGEIVVRDMAGRVVYMQPLSLNGNESQRIQLNPEDGLATGIYTLQAQLGSKQLQERFLVK